jgi:hypothetical protein
MLRGALRPAVVAPIELPPPPRRVPHISTQKNTKNVVRYPDFLRAAPASAACAAFCKESRMRLAGSIKLNRKSGVWGTPLGGRGTQRFILLSNSVAGKT